MIIPAEINKYKLSILPLRKRSPASKYRKGVKYLRNDNFSCMVEIMDLK